MSTRLSDRTIDTFVFQAIAGRGSIPKSQIWREICPPLGCSTEDRDRSIDRLIAAGRIRPALLMRRDPDYPLMTCPITEVLEVVPASDREEEVVHGR